MSASELKIVLTFCEMKDYRDETDEEENMFEVLEGLRYFSKQLYITCAAYPSLP